MKKVASQQKGREKRTRGSKKPYNKNESPVSPPAKKTPCETVQAQVKFRTAPIRNLKRQEKSKEKRNHGEWRKKPSYLIAWRRAPKQDQETTISRNPRKGRRKIHRSYA